jgi:hypothetical protein
MMLRSTPFRRNRDYINLAREMLVYNVFSSRDNFFPSEISNLLTLVVAFVATRSVKLSHAGPRWCLRSSRDRCDCCEQCRPGDG